jgi:two-component system, OmpR family, alkaline phosphatase synthesis response regulator PhoP
MVKRILVTGPERHVVRLIQVNVERQGYEVLTAFDVNAALSQAEARLPDIILLDAALPAPDILALLHSLKRSEKTRYITVLMLVEKDEDADASRTWPGADGFITKPLSPDEFQKWIDRWFR